MASKEDPPATAADVAAGDSAPPFRMDGGILAWLQVLGSWILFMNTW